MSRLWSTHKLDAATPTRARLVAVEPLNWAAGYAAGEAAARLKVEDEVAADRAALAVLASSIEALEAPTSDLMAAAITELAVRLAVAAAGTAIDAALLTARAQACAAGLADVVGPPTLVFHPDDFALIDGDDFELEVRVDPALARGSVRAEAGAAWAADGVTEAIARIVEAAGL